MKKRLAIGLSILVSLALMPSSFADQIFVEATQGTGIPQSDLDTTTSLVQSSVSQTGHQLATQASGADSVLKPELLRLGQAYILKITRTAFGDVITTSHLKAENIEELDKVALRVTQAVFHDKAASDDASVGEITDQEAKEGTQRRPVRALTYLGLGASAFSNMGTDNLGVSLGFGRAWDANQTLIKIMGNFSDSGSAAMLDATLGLDYFLGKRDLATYIGGAFGYGVAKSDGFASTRGGFILSPEAGLQIMRTSVVSLDLGFRAEFLLNSNELGHPACYSLRLGVYY